MARVLRADSTMQQLETTQPTNTTRTYKPFAFRSQVRPVDWHAIMAIDTERVCREVDVDSLQSVIKAVTFADLSAAPHASCLAHLCRLAQLILQYVLHTQEHLADTCARRAREVKSLQSERTQLSAKYANLMEETARLKHDFRALGRDNTDKHCSNCTCADRPHRSHTLIRLSQSFDTGTADVKRTAWAETSVPTRPPASAKKNVPRDNSRFWDESKYTSLREEMLKEKERARQSLLQLIELKEHAQRQEHSEQMQFIKDQLRQLTEAAQEREAQQRRWEHMIALRWAAEPSSALNSSRTNSTEWSAFASARSGESFAVSPGIPRTLR
eukprot:NODE_4010_length_1129_cov_81.991054_g3817_i0.p1 GENE.NODE_4010_length_1129_cov_81.991054_g3817_i0~~NODE_4010_length_1129_cov_81.991054_g3817_i0.p1  ORF type:complete len:328 (-),score=48.24 NODE_4010_length_1129_cov_81.991054_g3817_i0:5-988(-)